jgi:hypothetical protein
MKRFSVSRYFCSLLAMIAAVTWIAPAYSAAAKPYTLGQAVSDACKRDADINKDVEKLKSGDGNPDDLKADYLTKTNALALKLADAVIDYDAQSLNYAYQKIVAKALAAEIRQAQIDLKTGKIEQNDLDSLKKKQSANKFDLKAAQIITENSKLLFKKLTGKTLDKGFDFKGAYFIVDAAKLPVTLPDGTANGMDSAKLLVNAMQSYKALGSAISAFIKAGDALTAAQKNYKLGKIDKNALDKAAEGKSDSRNAVLQGKADYAETLYALDSATNGYICQKLKRQDCIFISSVKL